MTVAQNLTVYCLDCDHPIKLASQIKVGQVITCPNCEAELEVINREPLEVDFYYEGWEDDQEWDDEDEDWDDEDEDED